jgi:2-C-methyl-D-erythritol 2,4-cyclodiphosphate synthase
MSDTRAVPFRLGHGWDTHRLEPGRPLILGGVTIPAEFGLSGHSDADVLFHAVTDALLGALALGDIGMHFPDTAPEWRGANSIQFLEHALGLIRDRNYVVVNVDSTIILERPKLKDFRLSIRQNLANVLHLGLDFVSVKFKTAEGVGPVGEGKSCEAYAVILCQPIDSPLLRLNY